MYVLCGVVLCSIDVCPPRCSSPSVGLRDTVSVCTEAVVWVPASTRKPLNMTKSGLRAARSSVEALAAGCYSPTEGAGWPGPPAGASMGVPLHRNPPWPPSALAHVLWSGRAIQADTQTHHPPRPAALGPPPRSVIFLALLFTVCIAKHSRAAHSSSSSKGGLRAAEAWLSPTPPALCTIHPSHPSIHPSLILYHAWCHAWGPDYPLSHPPLTLASLRV
ncbi:unnamed protein product [Periconia digitata]|uniref:Uncharacterized protein n=1 Tax=Periconia digitata TaxID=1303443 RepID=A0A9W4UIV7_9PLEO|nr:unnamed protein product [Periconia digitata]